MESRILFLLPLVLHTFAAYSFCLLMYLQLRQYQLTRPSWGGWSWRTLTAVFALVYLAHLAAYAEPLSTDGIVQQQPLAARLILRAALPAAAPLLVQVFYTVERDRLPLRLLWITFIAAGWLAAAAAATAGVLADLDLLPARAESLPVDPSTVSDALVAAAGLCAATIFRLAPRPADSPFRRRQRRWYFALVCALEASFLLQLAWPQWFSQALRFLPLAFMLITVYYGERLAFWDVFAKRGLFFFLALVTLTVHFTVLGPYLDLTILGFAKAWIIALSILPCVAAAPWAYSRLNRWIDRVWLGRPFSPMDAVRYFSENVQAAGGEEDLLERAESSLREIFRSTTCIDRGPQQLAPTELTATLHVHGSEWGLVRILPRDNEIPFLSQDAELLRVLARTLGSMIESEELRSQKVFQERRERELALSAAQSELKALRAQINPHFLFNALNTIASLIPRKPAQAEETVEQLSEVFRYTVRHAEQEWVRVADEIDYVHAYLDIEQARFGERLQVCVHVEPAAREVRIPAMVIQTLAENAIKHGVAAVRGPGRIAIFACKKDSTLQIAVQDSGPGFPAEVRPESLPESSRGGYGLRNVRDRLRAHYGSAGRLAFGRSPAGATEVTLEIPIHLEEMPDARSDRG
jgi:anti-sigma regulatory factor (Ser/Thr protein kinase)